MGETFRVTYIDYNEHIRRGAGEHDPHTLRVTYKLEGHDPVSEWVCFEHKGFAHTRSVDWWKARSDRDVPSTVSEALDSILTYGIMEPKFVTISELDNGFYDIEPIFEEPPQEIAPDDQEASNPIGDNTIDVPTDLKESDDIPF